MKAIRIHEDGGPEVLRYEDAPDPEPLEVLIQLRAASLNRLDLWVRAAFLGSEAADPGADGAGLDPEGRRVVINPGIEHGDRISVVGEHMDGTHAELVAVPESNVYPIPDELEEAAAAFPLVFETAYRMLVTRAGLREGEWVLVWGAGSGIGTARSCSRGRSARGSWRPRRATPRSSSPAGSGRRRSSTTRRATCSRLSGSHRRGRRRRRRRARGRGDVADVAPGRPATRPDRGVRGDERAEPEGRPPPRVVEAADDPRLDDGHEGGLRGRLRARQERQGEAGVDSVYPLAEARAAHERMEAGEHFGKVVLAIPG